ncbi:MAG: hypothetical protein GX321_03160 [Clostridiales bacterium]|nr:hypothetical protein [Clostridiales bacterium]
MNRRKLLFLAFILVILFSTSCKKNTIDDQIEPDYSHFQTPNNTNRYKSLDNEAMSEEGNNENPSKDNSKKDWPYELDFKGVTSSKSYKTGNLNASIKSSGATSSLVCPDYDNDLIYYVNYGKDNYIYQLDDGISTLLVEKEAHSLQLWNNELYFIEDTVSSPKHSGNIYCLNLESEELRLVQKANAFYIHVGIHGIYYMNLKNDDGYVNNYYLDFDSSEPKEVDYSFLASYNEYQILHTYEDGFYLFNPNTKEKTFLAPSEYMNNCPMVSNEYFMFLHGSCIYTLNLQNGEKEIYDLYDYDSLSDYTLVFSDYCVIDKSIYATDEIRLYVIDMEKDFIEKYRVDYSIDYGILGHGTDVSNFSIQDLYTDGKKYMD